MKFLLFVLPLVWITVGLNGSFIDTYIDPSVRSYCEETQEKLEFKYSFRGRMSAHVKEDVVYLFTDDKIFSVSALWAALQPKQEKGFVLVEIFLMASEVKQLSQFWNNFTKSDEAYNTAFSDAKDYNSAYFLFGDKYRVVNITGFRVSGIQEPISFSESHFGFLQNEKIKQKGFHNIFGVDMASGGAYNPIRVYVRDTQNYDKAISFAFYNRTEITEEFSGGKRYEYSFNSSAFLNTGRSIAHNYNHYFELRTRRGVFSLFDFQYNRDFLLLGSTEELLGCPPSFCHWRQFDDIIRLHNGTQLLVFREWVWPFAKPGERVVWESAVIANIASRKSLNKNFNDQSFKFGIRHIVDGSFTDESTLYIFRNGSFISSQSDSIMDSLTPFENYTEIGSVFIGVPSNTFDALFYHKESRVVYFINDNKYWAFSMANKALVSADFPKSIHHLGLPFYFKVKSTYVGEDQGKQTEFYFFSQNHYLKFDSTLFTDGKFTPQKPEYKCTSIDFFGCPLSHQFSCPGYVVPGKEDEPQADKFWMVVLFLIAVIVAVIILIAILLLCIRRSTAKTTEGKPQTSSNAAKVSKTSTKSPKGSRRTDLPSFKSSEVTRRSHV